jgi:hypothetical protein
LDVPDGAKFPETGGRELASKGGGD